MFPFSEDTLRMQIQPGKVYRFYDTIPEGSNAIANHWYICFKVQDELVYLVCCTTQENTIDDYIFVNRLDKKTKVYIAPTEENGLNKDTFLNCNTIHYCEIDDLVQLMNDGLVKFSGEIKEEEFQKIRIGIMSSSVVEPYIRTLVANEEIA